jgi:hypothetical protein
MRHHGHIRKSVAVEIRNYPLLQIDGCNRGAGPERSVAVAQQDADALPGAAWIGVTSQEIHLPIIVEVSDPDNHGKIQQTGRRSP